MASGRPQKSRPPISTNLVDENGQMSGDWQSYFRNIDERLDGKYHANTSDEVDLSIAGYKWYTLTNNSVNLSPGVWRLTGQVEIRLAPYNALYFTDIVRGQWSTENGANNTTDPAAVTPIAGSAYIGTQCYFRPGYYDAVNTIRYTFPASTIRLNLAIKTEIFLNFRLFTFQASPGYETAFGKVYLYAERISNSLGRGAT